MCGGRVERRRYVEDATACSVGDMTRLCVNVCVQQMARGEIWCAYCAWVNGEWHTCVDKAHCCVAAPDSADRRLTCWWMCGAPLGGVKRAEREELGQTRPRAGAL